MKRILFLTLTLLIPFQGFMQQPNTMQDQDAAPAESKVKVLVIPFHPTRNYFSDCDKALGERSKVPVLNVRNTFRAGLDYASEQWIEKRYEPINLYQLKDSLSQTMLEEFYGKISYAYEAPTKSVLKKKKKILKGMKQKYFSEATGPVKSKADDQNPDEECYAELDDENDDKYMRILFKDTEFMDRLSASYGVDYFVTINQFEIKTDYEKCIDRDLGKYRRRIKVHYNVFTKDGKLVYGDAVTVKYNSTSDDVNRIIQDNFGYLAEFIMESLP